MNWLALLLAASSTEVHIDPCLHVAEAEVRRLTRIEIANTGAASPIRATVECAADGALVRVDDPITRKSLARTIDLSQVAPKARARYLALAIAELVEASWAELTLEAPRVVTPSGAAPASEARAGAEAQVRPQSPLRIEGFGVARRLPLTNLWQWGGGVRLALTGSLLGGALEIEGAHGERSTDLGLVSVDSATAALMITASLPLEPLILSGAIGARGGVGVVTGRPHDERTSRGDAIAAPWVGPCVSLRAAFWLSGWFLSVTAEGGLTVIGVRGTISGHRTIGLAGPWFGFSIGVGARP